MFCARTLNILIIDLSREVNGPFCRLAFSVLRAIVSSIDRQKITRFNISAIEAHIPEDF